MRTAEESPDTWCRMPPRIAPGTELLGEYKGSAFVDPQYLVRRGDGQFLQLPRLLYLLALAVDGRRTPELLAASVSEQAGRQLTAEAVEYLLEDKLRPLALLATEAEDQERARARPIFSLSLRRVLLPKSAVGRLAAGLQVLFWPPIVVVMLAGLVAVDWWLFRVQGVGSGVHALLSQPDSLLALWALYFASALFHEMGHATGCRYGGAEPGVIGAGIYLVWPAFYTDVTESYRLSRPGRLRVDLGGIYFSGIFIAATGAAYEATGFTPLLGIFLLTHSVLLVQLLPFVRFDGYYILADLTGVPDLFRRLGPTVRSVMTGRIKAGRDVAALGAELRPWARAAVTAWAFVTVPVIGYALVSLVLRLPAFLATSWRPITAQAAAAVGAVGSGELIRAGIDTVSMLLLMLPVVGAGSLLYRLGRRGARIGLGCSSGRRPYRVATLLLCGIGSVCVLLLWWSGHGYLDVEYWKGR